MTPKCPVCFGNLISGRCWNCGWAMDDFVSFRTIAVPTKADLNEWRKFQEVRAKTIAKETVPKSVGKNDQSGNNDGNPRTLHKKSEENKPVEGSFWKVDEKKSQSCDNTGEHRVPYNTTSNSDTKSAEPQTKKQKEDTKRPYLNGREYVPNRDKDISETKPKKQDAQPPSSKQVSHSATSKSDTKSAEPQTKKQKEDTKRPYLNGREYVPNRDKDISETKSKQQDAKSSSSEQHVAEHLAKLESKKPVEQSKSTKNYADDKKRSDKNYAIRLLISEIVVFILCIINGKNMWSVDGSAVNLSGYPTIALVWLSFYYFVRMVGKWRIPIILKILIGVVGLYLCILPVMIFTT